MLPAGQLRLAFEDGAMTVRTNAPLQGLLPDRVALVAAGDPVERLRAIKEPGELELIRAATELADEAVREIMEQGLAGRTEREVAQTLEAGMRRRGAQGLSFDSIVASGAHGALPHATPREVQIERGQLVVIDWGAELDGYCSDCTRTFATGDLSEPEQITYDVVLEAQLAGLRAIAPGVSGRDADTAARAVIDAAGHADHFGHGLGHGVGIEVHEAPRLSQRSDSTIEQGNVVTVEPGVYVPGAFGIRIEDLVVRHLRRARDPHLGSQAADHGRLESGTRPPMRRTDQRRAAVWALYQSDLLGRPLGETLPRDVHGFTFALAEQVLEHQPELDELIGRYASGWTL